MLAYGKGIRPIRKCPRFSYLYPCFTSSILPHLQKPQQTHHTTSAIVNATLQTQSLTLIMVRYEPSPLWLETEATMLKKRLVPTG